MPAPVYNVVVANGDENPSSSAVPDNTKSGAINTAGDYVVVSMVNVSGSTDVFYRRYHVDGAAIDLAPVRVNT